MGSDQVEGILTVGGSAPQAVPPPAHHGARARGNSSHDDRRDAGCVCPSSGCRHQRRDEVRVKRIQCDCHCLTCSYRSPGTSNRSIDDAALPPHVLAALAASESGMEEDESSSQRGLTPSHSSAPPSLHETTAAGGAILTCPHQERFVRDAEEDVAGSGMGGAGYQLNSSFPAAACAEEECVRISSSGPCARYGHSLTEFCPGHFLLFGGTDATAYFNDMFILLRTQRTARRGNDGTGSAPVVKSTWTELRPLVDAPSPRFGHTCHLHHTKQHLIFFGGSDNATWFNDMYALPLHPTGISRTFERIIPKHGSDARHLPCPRRSHTLVPYRDGQCVLFGGHSRVSLQDVWMLGADLTWTELETVGSLPSCPYTNTPESRYSHTAVIYKDTMYVFGGFCATGSAPAHMWALDLVTLVWTVVEPAFGASSVPCKRFGHSASLVGCRMIIFGGMDGFPCGKPLNDAYQLNLETLEWTQLMISDDGGTSASAGCSHDQGAARSTSSSNNATTDAPTDAVDMLMGPQARRSHAAALDSSGSTATVVIFGGWGECAVRNEESCLEMELSAPTLREIARNWIGARVVHRRCGGSTTPVAPPVPPAPSTAFEM